MNFTFFLGQSPEIQCISYTYSTSQFGLATFHVLNRHMWPVATVLNSTELEPFQQILF